MALQTAERVSSHEASDNVIFQRHLVAYNEAAKLIYGNVLEVGSGEGYGIELLASKVERYQAIDKYNTSVESYAAKYPHVHFQQMNIPPIEFPENTFDCIVTFQVIEHIEDDAGMVREMARVLKPGGLMIMTTPNIKMSLTRNPWHVREYTVSQLKGLLQNYFSEVDMKGVYGNQKVMDYYHANRKSVEKITRFDFFNLQYRLPRRLLQIPYDLLNRLNRRKLMKGNNQLVGDITVDDYYTSKANDQCFDLLAVAVK